jgi:hypothetical protein
MPGWVEEYVPPVIGLLGPGGTQSHRSSRRLIEVVGGEVQVNDGRAWPSGRLVVGDSLSHEDDAGDLHPG